MSYELFTLIPMNEEARKAVFHPSNSHLLKKVDEGIYGLAIGQFRSVSDTDATLAVLGRGGDVLIQNFSISQTQCLFELDSENRSIMLCDKSSYLSTQVFGKDATPFEHGRPRRVVVRDGLNTQFGMGGEKKNLVQFSLKWPCSASQMAAHVENREHAFLQENPRLARTASGAGAGLPTQRDPDPYAKVRQAPGEFGDVYEVVDTDNGTVMALKTLKPPPSGPGEMQWYKDTKREVETFSRISHPHIVECIAVEFVPNVKIFMGLKDGTLASLIGHQSGSLNDLGDAVLHDMLQALDYLAANGIIHRDLKPANILYKAQPGGRYNFQLSDFGFCNSTSIALSCVGTPLFMAPEIERVGVRQTSKADVWSLFVTMLWTMNANNFRDRVDVIKRNEIHRAVLSSAPTLGAIEEMGKFEPEQRASAAQMLVKRYNGIGLTTPKQRVPPLQTCSPPEVSGRGKPKEQRRGSRGAVAEVQPRVFAKEQKRKKNLCQGSTPGAVKRRRIAGDFTCQGNQ